MIDVYESFNDNIAAPDVLKNKYDGWWKTTKYIQTINGSLIKGSALIEYRLTLCGGKNITPASLLRGTTWIGSLTVSIHIH